MEGDLDRDARVRAARIARAYASAARDPVTPEGEAWIAHMLRTPLAYCIGLAIPPADWPSDFIDPELRWWEVVSRRKPGPRLARVDYGVGVVTMGW